jgi:hypothetical protein
MLSLLFASPVLVAVVVKHMWFSWFKLGVLGGSSTVVFLTFAYIFPVELLGIYHYGHAETVCSVLSSVWRGFPFRNDSAGEGGNWLVCG